MPTSSQALYLTLRYWRSAGLKGLELPEIEKDPALDQEERQKSLSELQSKVKPCVACRLGQGKGIAGEGQVGSEIAFVTAPPSEEEENAGEVLITEAGELFERMLSKMGLDRREIYLTPSIKCRPPKDRIPDENEERNCLKHHLQQELNVIRPKVVCTMGSVASSLLLGTGTPIAKLRGQQFDLGEFAVFPTFSPAHLLYKKSARKEVWEDMLSLLNYIGRKLPS